MFRASSAHLQEVNDANLLVCGLWCSQSVKVKVIVLGICYHFVKKETTMCGCIALCWTIRLS